MTDLDEWHPHSIFIASFPVLRSFNGVISLCLCLSVCLSVCVSLCSSPSLSFCSPLSLSLSTSLSVCLTPPVYVSSCLCLSLSQYPPPPPPPALLAMICMLIHQVRGTDVEKTLCVIHYPPKKSSLIHSFIHSLSLSVCLSVSLSPAMCTNGGRTDIQISLILRPKLVSY